MLTFQSAGRVRMKPTTATASTAFTGVFALLSRAQYLAPGTAPSRLNANSMREAEVRQAVVQKSWPSVAISRTLPDMNGVSAWSKMTCTPPPPADTAAGSCTAKRKASSRIQPPMAE